MRWKAAHSEERKVSLPHRTKVGSFEDGMAASPAADKSRRKSKALAQEFNTPSLRPQASQGDMMFSMDDDDAPECPESPSLRPANRSAAKPRQPSATEVEPGSFKSRSQKQKRQLLDLSSPAPPPSTPPKHRRTETKTGSPWGTAPLPVDKLDLRAVMSQSSSPGPSGIAAGLAAEKGKEAAQKQTPTKMSQKERKRQQQLEASQRAAAELEAQERPQKAWDAQGEGKAPWKVAEAPKTSLKDVMSTASTADKGKAPRVSPAPGPVKPLVAAEAASSPRRTASPDTRFSGQARPNASSSPAKVTPHSKSYIKPAAKAEVSLGLCMEDIIGQQRREAEAVREAVAKRPLEDIQQEQAFQEWWEAESRRTQEEEARRAGGGEGRGKGRARRRGKGREKGEKGEKGEKSEEGAQRAPNAGQASRGRGGGRPSRGRGKKVVAS